MTRSTKAIIILVIIAIILFGKTFMYFKPYQGTIPDPVQVYLPSPISMNVLGERGYVELSLLAEYVIEGVVKSKEMYFFDYPSQISKFDFALAWGNLNYEYIDRHVSYGQSGRWYNFSPGRGSPVDCGHIARHSANVHLIHSTRSIFNKLLFIRENKYIRLKGYLVSANFKDAKWKSSLTRSDTGNGACEIMYVMSVEILD